ncbi:hypothetical protein ETH_00039655 [Eimeria tenella]|uniref:Uncharacterized protein n=1 Tax=Eimeria tenella TaxID=5802 RepID=U6LA80_EIMTE|nr:hypothetical protein ETH_00039655 [Eimeria tenella]CDJ44685.1 hypothetical protein ETH_00039655 [Eimeria tenella]|eukprot:XP_013235433.1 hypothetical protein ETH_00039655 [Eimeria tenella]
MAAALQLAALLRSVPGGRGALGLEGAPPRGPPAEAAPAAAAAAAGSSRVKRARQQQQQQQQQLQQLLLLPAKDLLLMAIQEYFAALVKVLLQWAPFRRPAEALQQLLRGFDVAAVYELLPLPLDLFLGPHRKKLLLELLQMQQQQQEQPQQREQLQQQQQQQQLCMRLLGAQRGLLRQSLSLFLSLSHLASAYIPCCASVPGPAASWSVLRALVKALGAPQFPKRGGGPPGGPLRKQGGPPEHQEGLRLRVWLGSAQCALEIYGVVFEHVAVLLGTEAPPVPFSVGQSAQGGPRASGGPPGASLAIPRAAAGGPPGAPSAAEVAAAPLAVVLLLPRLVRALFGWLQLMSDAVAAPHPKALGAPGAPAAAAAPEGAPLGAPLLTPEALQRLRRLAWKSVEGALLGAFRYLSNCFLPAVTPPQLQQQQQQQQQQERRGQSAVVLQTARCCCCCCSSGATRRIRIRRSSSSSRNCSSSCSSSRFLRDVLESSSSCVLAQASLRALGTALLQWGPFIEETAVSDLLLRIHSIFPHPELLLHFLGDFAAAAAAAAAAEAAASSAAAAPNGREPHSPSRRLHVPVPAGLLAALRKVLAAAAAPAAAAAAAAACESSGPP